MAGIDDIISAEKKRLETVLRAAYEAGREAARHEMLSVLSGEGTKQAKPEGPSSHAARKRAPRGLPRKLVSRVLFDNDAFGSTPQDIVDAAITDDEKMIAISTIRSELRNGESDGIYQSGDGYWRLTPAAYKSFEETGKPDLPKSIEPAASPVSARSDPGWKKMSD